MRASERPLGLYHFDSLGGCPSRPVSAVVVVVFLPGHRMLMEYTHHLPSARVSVRHPVNERKMNDLSNGSLSIGQRCSGRCCLVSRAHCNAALSA